MQATPGTPIYSVAELDHKLVVLTNDENGKFVVAGARQDYPILINGDSATDAHAHFEFVAQTGGFFKIYSHVYGAFCSGWGTDWPLRPEVSDEQWSHFSVNIDANGSITMRSLAKPAQDANATYVALPSNWNNPITSDSRLRICERGLVPARGTFHAYAFSLA